MKRAKGFSLIELLIVIAILGIIGAIAYPMYQRSVIKAACDNGKAGLLQMDAIMNQIYMKYGTYDSSKYDGISGNQFAKMKTLPIDGSGRPNFDVTVTRTPTTYTITATAKTSGLLGKQGGALTINEKGEKGSTLGGVNVWSQGCKAL